MVLVANAVKNYRSASLIACKQSLFMPSSNRKAKARIARDLLAKGPLCGKRAKRVKKQRSKSFVLRTNVVGGVGVKKLHID